MAKQSKKQRKQNRREQQAKQPARSVGVQAPLEPTAIAEPAPQSTLPETKSPVQPTPVSASFSPTTSRGPDGIEAGLTALEYPAVRADLHRLLYTIIFFSTALAALSVLASQTSLINDLGRALFSLWQ